MAETNKDAPVADAAMAPYWEAARDGRLLLGYCHSCDRCYYYPRPLCPFCLGDETGWREASGAGTVYSWSVERRGKPPYIIAFVTLAEGPTILSNLVDCEPEAVAIGQHVMLAFETREEQPVPVFRPA